MPAGTRSLIGAMHYLTPCLHKFNFKILPE